MMTMMMSRSRFTASNTVMHQSAKKMMFSSYVFTDARSAVTAAVSSGYLQHLSPSARSNDCHICCQHQRFCHHHHHRLVWCRNMSSNSSSTSVEPDWVRTAIQKMIMEQQQQQQSENGEGEMTSPLTASTDRNLVTSMNGSTHSYPSTFAIFDNTDLEKTLQSLQV